ncbi:MAG: hypothetical protein AAF799_41110 [Myxococcota bacterium]
MKTTTILALCATTLSLLPGCYGRDGIPEDVGVEGFTNFASQDIHEVWEFNINAPNGCGDPGNLVDAMACTHPTPGVVASSTTQGSTCSLSVREYTSEASGWTDANGNTWYRFEDGADLPEMADAQDWLEVARLHQDTALVFENDCVVTAHLVPQTSALVSQFQYFTDGMTCVMTEIVINGSDPVVASNACAAHRASVDYVHRTVIAPI